MHSFFRLRSCLLALYLAITYLEDYAAPGISLCDSDGLIAALRHERHMRLPASENRDLHFTHALGFGFLFLLSRFVTFAEQDLLQNLGFLVNDPQKPQGFVSKIAICILDAPSS